MSLRVRLALWFGLVVAVGIGAASVLAYVSTEGELTDEIDAFLRQRAGEIDAGVRQLEGSNRGRNRDNNGLASVAPLLAVSNDSEIQTLGKDGDVTFQSEALPIEAIDLALADRDGPPVVRDITIDGVEYRMRTEHLSGGGAVQVARDMTETIAVLDRLRTRLGVVGVVLTALAGLVGWIVAARATRPLRRLSTAAATIAATQDLSVAMPAAGSDEVGRLAGSLDEMMDALAASRDQQQRLVMDAGHELRTPLTSLRTNVELLARADDLDPVVRREVLDGITHEVAELSDLVTELVEHATDTRDDEIPMEPVDLLDIVDGAVQRLVRRSDRIVEVVGEPTMVMGRAAQLERAVGNVIGNAHKFSPAGSAIDVVVDSGRVTVRDRGPGIPVEDLGRVFDRFYRSAVTRTMPGSGLGLAIVAQIVAQHGGTAIAENHPDGGAVVVITLPSID